MSVYFLNAEFNYPKELREKATSLIEGYVKESTQFLSIQKAFDVIIYPNAKWVDYTGVEGHAFSGGLLEIYIDLTEKKYSHDYILGDTLKQTVLHETNHIARWQGPGYGKSLIEITISEGIATAYEMMSVPEVPVLHGEYSQNLEELLTLYRSRDKEKDSSYDHDLWFFGNDTTYPTFVGYKVGTYIVDRVMKLYPEVTIQELTMMDASKILDLSEVAL